MASKLIVIEGLDGSGKGTQSQLITQELLSRGHKVRKLTFPDYNSSTSSLVKMYLGGELGDTPDDVNAYAASSFYAVDRVASFIKDWKKDYEECDYIIADRYVTSNIIYQMSKVPDSERDDYIEWCEDYEYNRLCVPKPDIVIYLDMPPEVSQKLMSGRYKGDESKKDIHEKNMNFLLSCRKSALYALKKLSWVHILCADGDTPKSIETITQQILDIIDTKL
ncbi:MAG: thymidylate kinase [Ruminococcaceae bacterium]|nr:thymidylate kinase [Oscillospiraceae bacterium]